MLERVDRWGGGMVLYISKYQQTKEIGRKVWCDEKSGLFYETTSADPEHDDEVSGGTC